MEQLVVLDKTGRADYVEWDLEDMSKEYMIETLKEDENVSAIYETMTNTGPFGLIWEREKTEVKDDEVGSEQQKVLEEVSKKNPDATKLDYYKALESAGFPRKDLEKIINNYLKHYNGYTSIVVPDRKIYENYELRAYKVSNDYSALKLGTEIDGDYRLSNEEKKKLHDIINEKEKLFKDSSNIKDAMDEDEYERLVYMSKYGNILNFYDFTNKTANMFEKVYKDLNLPEDDTYIVHPDVLQDDNKMKLLFDTLRKNIIEYLNADSDNDFDLRESEFYDVLNIFDIRRMYQ